MSMSDPLGDMLSRIRNAQRAHKPVVRTPASKIRANVLEVLQREGYIRGYSREDVRPGVSELSIELKYVEGEPVIREISRVSTPGRRIYSRISDLPKGQRGRGAISARMLSSSFLEVLCFWASLFANNFVQVTVTSFQQLFPSS